jgi:hypothetical protein
VSALDNLGRQWKQDPLIMTPKEVENHVQGIIRSNPFRTTTERILNNPHGSCYDATCLIHGDMPHGSHVAVYGGKHYNPNSQNPRDWYSNHFVHHVPTTEGMHAVDLTHRQFDSSEKTPLVEPLQKFQDRKVMRGFRTLRTDAEHAKLYTEGKKTKPLGKKMARELRRDVT